VLFFIWDGHTMTFMDVHNAKTALRYFKIPVGRTLMQPYSKNKILFHRGSRLMLSALRIALDLFLILMALMFLWDLVLVCVVSLLW
jgi:hypothetical protein